jgi:hypothetical protein
MQILIPEGFYALERAVLLLAQQLNKELWDPGKLTSAEVSAYEGLGDTVHYQELRKLLLGKKGAANEPQHGVEERLKTYEHAQRRLREALHSCKVRSYLQISQTGECLEQPSRNWAQETAVNWFGDGRAFIISGRTDRMAFGPYVPGASDEVNFIEQPGGWWATILIEKDSFDALVTNLGALPSKEGGEAARYSPKKSRRRRGPPKQYDWEDARLFCFQELDTLRDFDIPANQCEGWQSQNDLVRKLQEYMASPRDGGREPSDSVAKAYVARWVDEWRSANNSTD